MKKLNQFETLVIDEFEEDKFHLPTHSHTYYEIIYIRKGTGVHHLNKNLLGYKAGDLFVISPDDEHYFDIKNRTRFVFIKFTDTYFNSNKKLSCDEFLLNTPENFMRDQSLKENVLRLDDSSKTILRNTIENITTYNCRTNITNSPIVFYQILSIFGLIKETMRCMNLQITGTAIDNDQIISYIHQNIYKPKLVQIKIIANHFNISQTYFGAYFKRNFSITYRDYINKLRIQLIEKRIINKQMSIKQIAYEFGFTDESHLSNYFKKQRNIKPSEINKL
ncbi:AraC family transcriptional regulator [Flavobacterium cellulosilyticum]|uniref:AraC family transcriptional regulator n=1 Tax=Flavobacterium cellulosilyticum TaxID=2541731 RepID=A0A4R5CGM2_9FLAO|nr:AraC family transcriptional regulator [Flavobacterium cellulosilyticum]TDD99318.1 AraC family transcriptional regulator [Flavobacterium cellulosilyticum]